MKLIVATPGSVIVDMDDLRAVRAEDETGLFSIHPGHAEFITVLSISTVRWTDRTGKNRQIAVRGGILTVKGDVVEIATAQAIGESTLDKLGPAVLDQLRQSADSERAERISTAALELAVFRHVRTYLDAGRRPYWRGVPEPVRKPPGEG